MAKSDDAVAARAKDSKATATIRMTAIRLRGVGKRR
jgi:hypothetical protein